MSNETPPFRDHPAVRAVIGFGRVPDAVDAAIERHRAAREELRRASSGVDAAMTASKRAEAEADAVFSAASNADGAAWADLLATRPDDVTGAVRLLRYVSGSPASEVVEDPQDLLRQLLAAVEAGEMGCPAGEGAPGGVEPHAVAEPDPALAVVAEYRAAWDGLGEQVKTSWIGAAAEAADDAEAAAYARLRTVRPTTPAGFRALAETWAWRLRAERIAVEDGEPGSTASHAAASLIAGAGVCLPGSTDAPVSPALAELIARHRDLVRQSEARGLSDAVADPLFDEAWSAFRQACSFPIAGPADLAAKVDLMAAEITEGVERGEIDTATHAWNCLRADLLRPGVLEGLCADGADAELLTLVPIWEAARDLYERRVQEQIAVSDAASDIEAPPSRDLPHEEWMRLVEGWRERTGVAAVEAAVGQALGDLGKIEDRITALPARSLAGLRLKAMIARRHEDDDVEWPAGLGAGMARDLLALRGVQSTAHAASVRDWQAEAALHPGFVPFPAHAPRILMDLEGAIRGETLRLLELAEAEIGRRRAAYDGFHDPSVWPQVERDLRREMRMDALAVAAGSLSADDGAADPRLRALVTAWEAAERAGNAPGLSDDERAPLIDHASSLLRGLYAFPARTMADICAKLPAFRDEAANTGDAPDAPDTEVTLEACALRGLVADLERLTEASPAGVGAIGEPVEAAGPDPVLAAIVVSRKAELDMEMFQIGLDGVKLAGWQDREKELCRAQQAAREAVWGTVPTTQRGRRALVDYARFQVEVHAGATGIIDNAKALFEEILAPIAAAIDAERPGAASSVSSSDAATLVDRILTTWAALARAEDASDDEASEALLDHRAALLREAERLPVAREHLAAKALAFAWIGHAHLWRVGQAREDYAIDGRLALDIEATARRPSAMEG